MAVGRRPPCWAFPKAARANGLRFAEMFCGAGGFSEGARQAGFLIAASTDYCPLAIETHALNHKGAHVQGDITDPDIQHRFVKAAGNGVAVVCGGITCKGFSLSGKRDPLDERNQLYTVFTQVACKLRPDVIVIENVTQIDRWIPRDGLTKSQMAIVKRYFQEMSVAERKADDAKPKGVMQRLLGSGKRGAIVRVPDMILGKLPASAPVVE